jgi:Cu/Zn superoxide dismutase
MRTKIFLKQEIILLVILIGLVVVFVTACGAATPQNASATLKHSPSGRAELVWEPTTHLLTVRISLIGLAPKSMHPAHIHAGSCKGVGKTIVYPLTNVVADATGVGSSMTSIRDVTGGIPASGWYLNVHNGPGLTPDIQYTPITCADIVNPTPSLKTRQTVNVSLTDALSANQAASGIAHLTLSNGQLTVVLAMKGLVPESTHAAHIHAGSCASQGKIVYPLKPITADNMGAGSSTTVISDVASIPASGWYVNVHFSTDMSTQTGEDPIACGDVVLSH